MSLIYYAIPFFQLTMLLEWWKTKRARVRGYLLPDSAASLSMGVLFLLSAFLLKGIPFYFSFELYERRLFELPRSQPWVWLLLFFAEDFCFYWYHRLSHQVRLLWSVHVNHHSSDHYNLSTALRQPLLSPLFAWIFWAPLPLLGFHPLMVATAQSISLLYQYWIHTELIDRLGPLEWVLNTPSHHRVHHARDALYLDRNHGGILIIWDRLFGTFQQEEHAPDYGLTTQLKSYNPVVIAFHELQDLGRDLVQAKSWRGRLGYLLRPPGWTEDGRGQTASELRASWLREQASR